MENCLQPKKLLILDILEILKKYSDENHRLSQQDIIRILKRDYGMTADRKSVRRNLTELMDAGYPVCCDERQRGGADGSETVFSGWYMEHEFTDAELRLLIDSLLSSRTLPQKQCAALIKKIEGLSPVHFRSRLSHVRALPDSAARSEQFFYTVEILDEAISRRLQVSFCYCEYGTDKKKRPRTGPDGRVRRYLVNPYQMVVANGRYYLICNYDKYDTLAYYRIDRISDIRLSETPAKDKSLVKGLENGLDLPRHMAEHVYMFAGESVTAEFRADRSVIGDILDWFGPDAVFSDVTETGLTVRVRVNRSAMLCWALQYGRHVRVIYPRDLVEELAAVTKEMAEKYSHS